jgi:hypothetical protein
MGLDSVELLVEVEKKFNITIPDIEAEAIVTVGDFYETILKKIPLEKRRNRINTKCKTQKVFYDLRNILSAQFDAPKDKYSPRIRLKEIFSTDTIRKNWFRTEADLGLKLPRLLKPKRIQKLIHLVCILLLIVWILNMLINDMNALWLAPLIILLPAYYFLAEKIFDRYSTIPQFDSIRELVYGIVSLNYDKLLLDDANEKEIYWKLKGIISETMSIPLSEINYGARISQDLGIE